MKFENPANGHVESSSSSLSWLWVLLFGPLYWAFRGVWRHAVVHFILAPITLGLAHIAYTFFTYKILNNHYRKMGWKSVESKKKAKAAT